MVMIRATILVLALFTATHALAQTRHPPSPVDENLYERAEAKRERRDFDGAVEDLTQAIRAAPTNARAYYLRGCVEMEKHDNEKAL